LTEKNAANVTESYTYDLNGAMLSKTDRKGVPTLYTYDNRGRLLTETVGNLVHSYTYGLNGALLNESKAGSSLAYVYDGLGRLTQESHDGYVKNYAYNIGDLRTSFTLKNGSTTLLSNTYAYDALGQMTDVTGSGVSAEYGYDANGNLSGIYYNNTSSQTFSYNGLNMVDSIVMTGDGPYIGLNAADPGDGDVSLFSLNESLMDQITFDYDLAGRKIGSSSLFGDTKAYGYDPKGQLISESCSNNLHGSDYTKTYTYDPRGNRITLSDSGTSTAYTYNAVNHLQNSTTSGTATTYTYDANGNTLTDKVGSATATTYTYNADDQLTGISGAGLSVSYTYYPNGLRKTKTVNGVTTTYVWDGDQLVYESDVTQRKYVRGPLLAASVVGSTKTYYLYDDHGNVFVLTDDQYGAPVRVYAYDAFGNQLNIDPTDTNPFRYCGEYWDAETGSYYLRARYYDSSIGRFTQEDPHWNTGNMVYGDDPVAMSRGLLDLEAEYYLPSVLAMRQSGNLYVYVANNPVLYIDSSGKFINTLVGGALGGASGAASAFLTGKNVWHGALAGVVGGLISGFGLDVGLVLISGTGGIGTGMGITITTAAGAFGSLASNVTEQLLSGKDINNIDWDSVRKSAGLGAGFSLVSLGLGRTVNNAFEFTPAGQKIIEKLASSLRRAGMMDTSVSAFLSAVFVEMPKWVADSIVNSSRGDHA